MHRKIVALLHDPWPSSFEGSGSPQRRLAVRFRRALHSRANPRSEAYMRCLLRERWREVEPTCVGDPGWQNLVAHADVIVLLYPDAIGQGFAGVEREIAKHQKTGAEVRVLNGRRREFLLLPAVLRGLRTRRFLERTMLAEWLFLALFAIATPALLLVDLARGRW